ncbi:MAG: hypothetical protein A2939_04815 [Parcubacteria group bacterium RIFCSPLOWO2_01_FULL_48_18]|nr:MAG: hypothetical protein A2939_04815 [Parcubacteria group bacterium RIFCSPLOWO2_01_FULL_48_18]OHB24045.1 MAG: hypothetical protein A3J67_04555 [Parcubacteria group bacterium RIFCSPHIGHO2_02_FULL_48_10b]
MAKKVFVVTGLGYGDEGKGTITHWLCHAHRAHTVVRTGGPQALHRVVTAAGKEHVFSQFGSGTLCGSATHLSKHMVIDPYAILKEGEALMYEHGVRGLFDMLTIHEDALVITPFQAIVGRLRELLRGAKRHGSVGIGVGETVLDDDVFGDTAVRAKDLNAPSLRTKLEAIRLRKLTEFEEIRDRAHVLPPETRDRIQLELRDLEDPDTIQWAVEQFTKLACKTRVVGTEYVAKNILESDGTVVFESSQGVLLDRWYGFHPYTTKVRTIPGTALSIIRECAYGGEINAYGILRAYHTRHGAGPFVTESSEITALLPDASNRDHAWQGNFRVGQFDLVAARYAVDACGSHSLDGIILTCMDRIRPSATVRFAERYESVPVEHTQDFFRRSTDTSIERIIVRHGQGPAQLQRQEKLGKALETCSPRLTQCTKNIFPEMLADALNVPIVAISTGQTEDNKSVVTQIEKRAVSL